MPAIKNNRSDIQRFSSVRVTQHVTVCAFSYKNSLYTEEGMHIFACTIIHLRCSIQNTQYVSATSSEKLSILSMCRLGILNLST